jgi:hypothetical protein
MKKHLLGFLIFLAVSSSAFAKIKVNVDFQKYFDEQKNPVVKLEIDGNDVGEYSPDPTAKSKIYFNKSIKFVAEEKFITGLKDNDTVTLKKGKKGKWNFYINDKKLHIKKSK